MEWHYRQAEGQASKPCFLFRALGGHIVSQKLNIKRLIVLRSTKNCTLELLLLLKMAHYSSDQIVGIINNGRKITQVFKKDIILLQTKMCV